MIKTRSARRFTHAVSAFGASVLDFVYPPFCMMCVTRLQEEEILVCKSCWQNLPGVSEKSNEHGFTGIERLLSVWQYSEAFQRIVHEMKFFRKKSLCHRMAEDMSRLLLSDPEMSNVDFLIPVPLHRVKFRERGFNQSYLLARYICEKSGIPITENLIRIRMTKPQSKLGSEARRKNVDGAFTVQKPEQISDKEVILVDDVVTTGSTLTVCAAALRQAGVSRVFAITAGKTL